MIRILIGIREFFDGIFLLLRYRGGCENFSALAKDCSTRVFPVRVTLDTMAVSPRCTAGVCDSAKAYPPQTLDILLDSGFVLGFGTSAKLPHRCIVDLPICQCAHAGPSCDTVPKISLPCWVIISNLIQVTYWWVYISP